jgi:hypothetical protein
MASNKPTEQERKREFLFKIAHRAEQLLKESPNPQQEMSWAENRLLHENLMGFDPSRKSPAIWTDQTIARNPDLMDQTVTLSKMSADCLVTLWSATVSRSGKLTPLPFDIGIDPGYRLDVSERLLVQKDGPMLETIKALSGGLLRPA